MWNKPAAVVRLCLARAVPEESEAEPTEGRSSPRRGGFATRADFSSPQADAVSVRSSKSLQIKAESNRVRFAPSAFSVPDSAVTVAASVSPGPRPASPLKLLGKAVPQVVVEFAPPWNFVAEFRDSGEWSRLAVAIRTYFGGEYAKRRGK